MIVEALLTLISTLLKLCFGWKNLPNLPDSVMSVVNELFGYIEGSIGIMGVFIDLSMVRILLPVLLIVVNFEEVWKFTMFILKKIPFLGIE
ncbi:MAG: hypothetical protein Q4C69_12475 [Lachnoclostridium edouardi]|uniref:hypothetical protein n=1 Tax=Lachnoclostridium edouardi TaxID=1926283 RepID=UPI0026DB8B05|nr:hypothetical protein [Lachnoclostridium edouardi]MDO4279635.1 hypothetical protein [Lachnoclostridium edouardi]